MPEPSSNPLSPDPDVVPEPLEPQVEPPIEPDATPSPAGPEIDQPGSPEVGPLGSPGPEVSPGTTGLPEV
ncbi:hypothetical protein [Rhizobacter sp. LjRoot28]|jgi:hypothetical protein|uniref:hypothetical protein n=1 Tax=Rhizobacter sp. LjRoot28 TaxID=3342309 RepID=UPI003ECC30F5